MIRESLKTSGASERKEGAGVEWRGGGEERKRKQASRANYDRKGGREKFPCLWFWFPEQRLQQFIIFLQAGPVWFNGRIKYAVINEQLHSFMDRFNYIPCLELLEKRHAK